MLETTQNLVQRTITPEVVKHLGLKEITLIIGPRQTGKTTLLYQLRNELLKGGTPESNIFIFNLDIFTELEPFTSQQTFIDFLKKRINKRVLFVFVDEAQRIKNAGLFFKGIYDLNLPVKFVLTGSSALEIKSNIHEPLTGRKRLFHLYPFSFQEYLSSRDKTLAELVSQDDISAYDQKQLTEHLFTFINWGGYPRAALETNISEKEQLLKEIFSSYIEKDVIGFLNIKSHFAFSGLVSLLASQAGQLVNTNELSQSLKIERKTIERYLEILEKTFIIKKAPPFFRNSRKEITKMPKIYFLDTGLRNFGIKSFQEFEARPDKGALLENFIFSEVSKQGAAHIYFWRTKEKTEVDFVLADYVGNLLPIEVKAASLKSPEVSRGFRSFIERYKPEKALLVNLGFQGKIKLGKTDIIFIHPYKISEAIRKFYLKSPTKIQ